MACSTLKQDSESLLQTLNNHLQEGHKGDCIPFKTFNCKDYDYIIYHVSSEFQHPLKDIVKSVKNNFFLVSKLPVSNKDLHDNSTDEESECVDQEVDLALPITTQQLVFVGTPIHEKLHHLFQQHDLQSWQPETIEKHMDLSSVEKLNIKNARYFLSLYVQCLRLQKDLPEVWLLCYETKPQETTHLGMVPSEDPKLSEKSLQQVSAVVIRSQHVNAREKDAFSLKEQKKMHVSFHKARCAETHGYAMYKIYGAVESFKKDSDSPESSITMEFAWNRVKEILQPPPPSSNAVLKICAHPADVKSILPVIACELDSLLNHYAVLTLQNSCKPAVEDKEDFDQQELKTKVLAFLEDLKLNRFGTNNESMAESSNQSPASNLTASFGIGEALRRQDLDNTECLWLFLEEFTSADKIVFCLQVIFSALFEGEYQPVLCTTNQTQIGKLMKEIVCCKTDREKSIIKMEMTQAFSTSVALECVLEIGLEKLRKDYSNFFIKQELVTKDRLDYYLAKDVPMAKKVQRLSKLHCILSLVTLAISYGHVKYPELRELVVAALKFYEKHNHNEHPVFCLSLPTCSASSDVKNVCIRQFQPQTWTVAITTMNEHITVVKVEENDHIGIIFDDSLLGVDESSCKGSGSYLATTGTVSHIFI